MQPQTFIFMGRSGAGKGTQATEIMELLKKKDPTRGIIYIQTGQELRQFIKGQSFTEKVTKKMYDEGGLMPEFIAIYVWVKALVERYTGNEHFIFDGIARRVEEAKILGQVFGFYGLSKPWVIEIDVGTDEATRRLLARKRFDDNEAEIRRRLAWYDTEVRPSVEYFSTSPLFNFVRIEGEHTIKEIHEDIVKKVGLE